MIKNEIFFSLYAQILTIVCDDIFVKNNFSSLLSWFVLISDISQELAKYQKDATWPWNSNWLTPHKRRVIQKNTTRFDDLDKQCIPGVNSVGLCRSFLSGQSQLNSHGNDFPQLEMCTYVIFCLFLTDIKHDSNNKWIDMTVW